MYKILIRDGIFIDEYRNPENTECRYCGLSFAHLHKKDSNLIGFTKVKEETWEEKFEKKFCDRNIINVLCWKFKREEDPPSPKDILDFIRREFI